MVPLLYPNDTVLVLKLMKGNIGDIVIIKNPQKENEIHYLIKKITAMNKTHIYVEGLNKSQSIDSRHFGWIPKKLIVGKMIIKI